MKIGLRGFVVLQSVALLHGVPGECATRFDVEPDKGDIVIYGFGGGEVGAGWSEITLQGDGTVGYRNHSSLQEPPRDPVGAFALDADETKRFLQSLVNAGLFELRTIPSMEADSPLVWINATIDGHTLDAHIAEYQLATHKAWRPVLTLFEELYPFESRLDPDAGVTDTDTVAMTYTFASRLNTPNSVARIDLPEGFEVVSGSLVWRGALPAAQEQQLQLVLRSTQVGFRRLEASVASELLGGFRRLDTVGLETTTRGTIIIGGQPPTNHWYKPNDGGVGHGWNKNNEHITSDLIISTAPVLKKEFTVTYRVTADVDLPDPQRTQMSVVFPPKAWKIVKVEFPKGGKTYKNKTQRSWKGAVRSHETITLSVTFRVLKTGWGEVFGSLDVQQGGSGMEHLSDLKVADLYVDQYGGSFTVK